MPEKTVRSTAQPIASQERLKPQRALLSLSDKRGLIELATLLSEANIDIISTGGTAEALKKAGFSVCEVAQITGFPEILDGRVKTLHPHIHGAILARPDQSAHVETLKKHAITPIDLIIVTLYPFEATVAAGQDYDACIENIDIGGPAMIRSAAKNHHSKTIIINPDDYKVLGEQIKKGGTTFLERRYYAQKAFAYTAAYDRAIADYFSKQGASDRPETLSTGEDPYPQPDFPRSITLSGTRVQACRYGENPHQKAAFYRTNLSCHQPMIGLADAIQHQGKALSYNNIADSDAALQLISELGLQKPAVAIIKHANPCGAATASGLLEAYKKALACDPVSAFGGIIACNQPLDEETAFEISKLFTEVILAPGANAGARALLARKKNLRLLELPEAAFTAQKTDSLRFQTITGGFLLQDWDQAPITPALLKQVSKRAPTPLELDDLLFAFRIAKHVKSNAIVYARDQMTVGIGAGQMNRRDSVMIAAKRALEASKLAGLTTSMAQGSVVASDAFFPFADGLIAAAEAGATAIIQPGGSLRDAEVIKAADDAGLAMVFTGQRHFRH